MWPDADRPELSFLVGIDLAQGGADFTAIAVVEKREFLSGEHRGEPADYAIAHLDRWRSTKTALIPEKVAQIVETIRARRVRYDLDTTGVAKAVPPQISLIVDQTGVGPFGLDPLRATGFRPIGIQITGGDSVNHPQPDLYRVPKRDIAGALGVALGTDRLRIADALPLAPVLRAEMQNFRARITLTGHDTYAAGTGEAWREGEHDDLVLAAGIAVWYGEHRPVPRLDPAIARAFHGLPNRRRYGR